jgi:4-hydroxythreonine-4-phosphate dehydrogenase
MALPLIALTMGDPAGVGPEICLRSAREAAVLACCRPVIIGDLNVLRQCAELLDLELAGQVYSADELMSGAVRAELNAAAANDASVQTAIVDCAMIDGAVVPGVATAAGGAASYRYFTLAIEAALAGAVDAIATAPINKLTLHMAGIDEPGHTEILARMCGSDDFAMMLYSPRLSVSLVTCHQSLRSVPDAISSEKIVRVTALTRAALRRLRGREPRLAVLGLNPHAGEEGLFGDEEQQIVEALAICRELGIEAEGPLSPDAAFMPNALRRYDGHIVMYHDQGLIPFKMISLHDGVNVTLGTPVVRTSVDHGTAYNIAWRGRAETSSLLCALELAARLAGEHRERATDRGQGTK